MTYFGVSFCRGPFESSTPFFLQTPQENRSEKPWSRSSGARGYRSLTDFESSLVNFLALLGISGVKHGNLSKTGPVSAVLLILRTVLTRIVSHDNDKAAFDARIRDRHERVGRYVQPQRVSCRPMPFHRQGKRRGQPPRPPSRWETIPCRFLVLGQLSHNFAARRPGIGAPHHHTRLQAPSGQSPHFPVISFSFTLLHLISNLSFFSPTLPLPLQGGRCEKIGLAPSRVVPAEAGIQCFHMTAY